MRAREIGKTMPLKVFSQDMNINLKWWKNEKYFGKTDIHITRKLI